MAIILRLIKNTRAQKTLFWFDFDSNTNYELLYLPDEEVDLSVVSSSAAEIAAAAQTSLKSLDTLICSPAK